MRGEPKFPKLMGFQKAIRNAFHYDPASGDKAGLRVSVDGRPYDLGKTTEIIRGEAAFVTGATDANFLTLCKCIDVRQLGFKGMRVTDLTPLSRLPRLEALKLWWNPKLTSIEPLTELHYLRLLILDDHKRLNDLAPLAQMTKLKALHISGGMWTDGNVKTLAPLQGLDDLRELSINALKVEQDGLRPLARCKALRDLRLSNQFDTSDYAYLAVHLPNVVCVNLTAYVEFETPIGDKDVMVTGRRKPHLNSLTDAKRLQKYSSQFEKLVDEFRSDLK